MDKYPSALRVEILQRVYSVKDFQELMTQYELSKYKKGPGLYEPTKQEIDLFKKWINDEIKIKSCAEQLGISGTCVRSHFSLIGKKVILKEIVI